MHKRRPKRRRSKMLKRIPREKNKNASNKDKKTPAVDRTFIKNI
jgi:hypothetical protein